MKFLVCFFSQAQKCVRDLDAQLEELKAAGEGPTEELKVPTTHLHHLKFKPAYPGSLLSNSVFCMCLYQERLEKEKKLTRDLGQAATKLQQLLKSTQEELDKEKETVKNLQEQLHGKVHYKRFPNNHKNRAYISYGIYITYSNIYIFFSVNRKPKSQKKGRLFDRINLTTQVP